MRLRRLWGWLIVLLIVSGLAVLSYRHLMERKPSTVATQKSQLTVTTLPLQYHLIPQTVSAYATTMSPTSIQLLAATSGVIKKVWVHSGQQVDKGQLLFTIHSSDLNAQLNKLKAQWLTDKRKLTLDRKVNRQVPGTVPKYDMFTQRMLVVQDRAAYKAAKSLQKVKSPVKGRLSETLLAAGSVVNTGDILTDVISQKGLRVRYQIADIYADAVKLGQAVTFSLQNGKHYTGKVSYIAPLYNAHDYSLTLRAKLDPADALPPNVFGQVKQVIQPRYRSLAISQKLVQVDARGFYVFSIDPHQKVVKRYFTPGAVTARGLIEVRKGLTENLPIINSDLSSLSAGQKVQVRS